jgi:hypothetical protein
MFCSSLQETVIEECDSLPIGKPINLCPHTFCQLAKFLHSDVHLWISIIYDEHLQSAFICLIIALEPLVTAFKSVPFLIY